MVTVFILFLVKYLINLLYVTCLVNSKWQRLIWFSFSICYSFAFHYSCLVILKISRPFLFKVPPIGHQPKSGSPMAALLPLSLWTDSICWHFPPALMQQLLCCHLDIRVSSVKTGQATRRWGWQLIRRGYKRHITTHYTSFIDEKICIKNVGVTNWT